MVAVVMLEQTVVLLEQAVVMLEQAVVMLEQAVVMLEQAVMMQVDALNGLSVAWEMPIWSTTFALKTRFRVDQL
jgi:hypothetical protein